jgi:hypothetical protein
MAQGIVRERFGLDADQAFNLLRRLSSTSNVKVSQIAREIVETRRLPVNGSHDPGNGYPAQARERQGEHGLDPDAAH